MDIRLIIISIISFLIIIFSEYTIYYSLHYAQIIKSTSLEISLMIIGLIMPILFIVSTLVGYKNYYEINSWVNTISSLWLGIIFYVFLASLIIFTLLKINKYLNFNLPIRTISGILLLIVITIFFYGIYNANNIRISRIDIKSEKLRNNWSGKKILVISDIHLGNINKKRFLNKVVDKINKEKPDIIFNIGDLIDGPTVPYKDFLNPLSKLKPELGNYYVEGNHEKYNWEYEKFLSNIPSNVIDLTNKKIIVENTQIIGIDDFDNSSSVDIGSYLSYLNYNPSTPSIILIHKPTKINNLAEYGVSLVLSGHTHNGQMFPFNLLIKKIYGNYAHGLSYTKNTASLTTSGVGTAMIPMRVLSNPEIVVINIK